MNCDKCGSRISTTYGCLCTPSVDSARNLDRLTDAESDMAVVTAERDQLLALLAEWYRTPYYATEAEWRAWVDEFRPRVAKALGRDDGVTT